MLKRTIYAMFLLAFFLFLHCTDENGAFLRDNPMDPGSPNWSPIVTAMQDTTVAVYDSFPIHAKGSTNGDASRYIKKYLWALNGVNFRDSTDSVFIKTAFTSAGIKTVLVKVRENDGIVSAKADTVLITVHLYAPVVNVTTPDTNVAINDSFFIRAIGTDTNGTIKKYFWALDSGFYRDSTDSGRIKKKFTSAGIKTVLVKARDDDGIVSAKADTVKITVHSYAPVVTVTTPDTDVAINDSFFIRATGTDTNGTVKKYLWALNGINYSDSTDSGYIKTKFTSAGIKTVLVKARDDDGIVSAKADTVLITVQSFAPRVVAMPDTDVGVNDTFFVHATGTDSNGTIKKYLWALYTTSFNDSTDTGQVKAVFTTIGAKQVLVKVRDNDGVESAIDTVMVTVHLYRPSVTAMNDTDVAINDSFSVHASGTDTNGTVRYLWAMDGVNYKDTTDSAFIKTAFTSAGIKTVLVKVRDDDGIASVTDTVMVTVHLYRPSVTAMNDTDVAVNDSFSVHAAGTDTNGTVRYLWAFDGVNYNDSTDSGRIETAFTSAGIKTALVKVRNNGGIESAVDTVIVTVHLYRPVVAGMPDTNVALNDSFFIRAIGTDTNGTVRYLWALDSGKFKNSTDSGSIKTAFTSAGIKTVLVKVMDDDSIVSAVDSIKVIVSDNPPITVSPADSAVITDSLPAFSWIPGFYADSFRVLLDTLSVPVAVAATGITDSFFTLTTALPSHRTYYWQVIGLNAAGLEARGEVRQFTYAPAVIAMPDTDVAINDSFLVRATGIDTRDTVMKYLWAFDGINYTDSTDSGQVKTAFLSAGLKTVLVKVRDSVGVESEADTVKVTVHLYQPSVTVMNDTTVARNDSFFVHAAGMDTNGTIRYLWALDGITYKDTTDSGRVKTAFTDTGVKTVLVKVRDDDDIFSAADTVKVTVKESAPIAVSPADSAVITDSLPTFSWVPGFYADSFRVLLDTLSVPVSVAATGVTDSFFTCTIPLTAGRTYYWQVIGLNAAGQEARGEVRRFSYDTLVPYTSDANTVLLDHFDGSTSASINGVISGAECVALTAATPTYAYDIGQGGLGQAVTLGPPAGQPAGSSSYLQYPTMDMLCSANGTIEFWVYTTAYGISLADQGEYYNSCGGWTFRMGIDSTGHLTSSDWDGYGDWNVTSSQVVPLNIWTHVAVTWGSAGVRMYINGAQVGSHSSTYAPDAGWGGYLMMRCGSYKGAVCTIDELRVSNVQRTSFNLY
jgi:hypothetical protein